MANIPTTQRAYTLRLRGATKEDKSWRDALWATHEAVNNGAKTFGDWLLTLRGGLDHDLADATNTEDKRRDRRIILALSWLSVESQHGARFDNYGVQLGETVDALREILRKRGLNTDEFESWATDCAPSLNATIRDDACWINRSRMFDDAVAQVGNSLTREELWDLLGRFFRTREKYFEGIASPTEDGGTESEDTEYSSANSKKEELIKPAGRWLCDRVGKGPGADYTSLSHAYRRVSDELRNLRPGDSGPTVISELAGRLSDLCPRDDSLQSVLSLIGATGHKSATRNLLKKLSTLKCVQQDELNEAADVSLDDSKKAQSGVGRKGSRVWASELIHDVESAVGFTYIPDSKSAARHPEFSVMLDHAARRICQCHSWIKIAESNRRRFEHDAKRIADVPPEARTWLDSYCSRRTDESGAVETIRIRKGAVTGWREVLTRWGKDECISVQDRIDAAREAQADPEIEKFGDIQLFEALAAESAKCVWQDASGDPIYQPLEDYAAASDAEDKRRRFKVPRYCHPDPLRHPVFCDFGESRWSISYSVHVAQRELEKALANIARTEAALAKAANAIEKAKTPAKLEKANQQLHVAQQKHDKAHKELTWLRSRHGVRLTLWNGQALDDSIPLRWSSKRLTADFALHLLNDRNGDEAISVTRADRLGRSAAGADGDSLVRLRGLFDQKYWNGRLQAPRAKLDAIAKLSDHNHLPESEKQRRIRRAISRIPWLITLSARLCPRGPWCDEYAPANGLHADPKRWPHASLNKSRKGKARLILARLPKLRILGVDLGLRYAAACAVWSTMSAKEVAVECKNAGISAPQQQHLYWFVPRARYGRTILRRIGADTLPDGSLHPAPWAKLERQFLIKLQGEERPARSATPEERAAIANFEEAIGYQRPKPRSEREWRVDVLMNEAVRTAKLGLRNHSDYARLARGLNGERDLPGGRTETPQGSELLKLLRDVLRRWHSLATSERWVDRLARDSWAELIRQLDATVPLTGVTVGAHRKDGDDVVDELNRALEHMANKLTPALRKAWAREFAQGWEENDRVWKSRLRWLNRWIMGRRIGTPTERSQDKTIRRVGGLSLGRIETMKSLYQVQKAYFTRLTREGKSPPAEQGFGQRTLRAMERLRENRVKQLASRIVEAALGVGREPEGNASRSVKRPRSRVYPCCHAVVIEDLKNYRPDELQTRRENRQLMTWSARNVQKYLGESCELHGLHLREISPAYTSRHDARTGLPGERCIDVAVSEFLDADSRWQAQVQKFREVGTTDAFSRYLVHLDEKLRSTDLRPQKCVRIPKRGGEIFVPSGVPNDSVEHKRSGPPGLQADLNAAANIGLKALLDPDWVGAWWYIPAVLNQHREWVPKKEACEGSAAVDLTAALAKQSLSSDVVPNRGRRKGRTNRSGRIENAYANFWDDVSAKSLSERHWRSWHEYRNWARQRVIDVLRAAAGLRSDRECRE
jgi:IS605 OrfB family transposase